MGFAIGQRGRHSWIAGLAFAVLASAGACGSRDQTAVSAAIDQIVAAKSSDGVSPPVWTDAKQFYERLNNTPAWISGNISRSVQEPLKIVRAAADHGLDPAS